MATARQTPQRPHQRLKAIAGHHGSIGQFEALAGVNIQSHEERFALWDRFRHLAADSQAHTDAVMDYCAEITLARVQRGELCIIPRRLYA